ncbi:MAG: hypothetical protein WCC64_04805 [Aliidongia sp.]
MRAALVGERADLADDPRQEIGRQVVFRLLKRKDRQRRDPELVVSEAIHLTGDNQTFKIENRSSEREIEQGLLAIAQRVEPALAAVRPLFEDDRDPADDLLEPAAD